MREATKLDEAKEAQILTDREAFRVANKLESLIEKPKEDEIIKDGAEKDN
jgi:hypothetical protein